MVDITEAQDGGVLKTILTEGVDDVNGDHPRVGDTVIVHYVGTLLESGEQFDSSRDRDSKFEFKLSMGQVIKGWDVGVATMKRGEKSKLVCSADYAYGVRGSPPKIPGDASLVFEVELFDWRGEDMSEAKDQSVLKRIYKKSESFLTPNEGAIMDVAIQGFVVSSGEQVIDFKESHLVHGEEESFGLPALLEKTLDDMKAGEQCEIIAEAKHGFTKQSEKFTKAPVNEKMKYVVDMVKFEKAKESWEMSAAEALVNAGLKKDKATEELKKGNYEVAIKLFGKVLALVEDHVKSPARAMADSDDSSDESEADESAGDQGDKTDKVKQENEMPKTSVPEDDPELEKRAKEFKEIFCASQKNLSLCHLKTKDYKQTIDHCDEVLKLISNDEKALFRKADALFYQHEYGEAKLLYQTVCDLYPENKNAKRRVGDCDQKVIDEKKQEKQRYQNMFRNFST